MQHDVLFVRGYDSVQHVKILSLFSGGRMDGANHGGP